MIIPKNPACGLTLGIHILNILKVRLVQLLVIDFLGVDRENMNMVERNNRGAVAAEQTAVIVHPSFNPSSSYLRLPPPFSFMFAFIAAATAIAIVDWSRYLSDSRHLPQ